MKNRDVIIPEVNRVKHTGGGGVHVSGWFQHRHFDKQSMNQISWPVIQLRRTWDFVYSLDIMRRIDKAKVVNVTKHPCDESPVPKYSVSRNLKFVN